MPSNTSPNIPAHDQSVDRAGGHWLLARVGKKILRPGGRETTNFLLENLPIQGSRVVEFAPGLGITAAQILDANPRSYTGVDSDADACAQVQAILPQEGDHRMINTSATDSGLPDGCADVVVGEAMLTMQTDKHKLDIMREAARLLVPGGTYAIHEMELVPNEVDDAVKDDIRRALARAIKVNARPITVSEWTKLFDAAGFDVLVTHHAPMGLLQPRRVLADEGLFGTARIIFNVLRQPDIRRRVLTMRRTFSTHSDNLGAIGMVLIKRATD